MTVTIEHACGTHTAYKLTCEDYDALCHSLDQDVSIIGREWRDE